MAVLRYFHLDPKQVTVKESSVIDNRGTTLTNKITNINTSITNNTQAIDDKQDAIPGKSLSSNDFTNYYKKKLDQIEEGAEVNVQADWDESDDTADSYIQNKPSIDTVVIEDSNNLITSGAVFNAIDALPEPMIFKGSLGVNGTILTLPTAASGNTGYVYKVITTGTYDGLYAEPGDTFISDGAQWIHIPSGDEPNGTVTNVAMTVPTGLEVSGTPITTSGTLAITYALGYSIPTLVKQAEWDAKQDAISDLSTIRSNASYGATAYSWGDHSQAGYQMAIPDLATIRSNASTAYGWGDHSLAGYQMEISDLSTIRSNAGLGATAYGWGNHALAGYLPAISDLATIRSRADEGHTAYGWGDHSQEGYVKSSGVTSIAMTVPTGLSVSGSPVTSTGTFALTFANGYSIPTTAKLSNWDTAYGWGNHADAGYVKSSGVTSVKMTVPTGFSIAGSPITSTGTLALTFASGYSLPTTTKLSNWDTAYSWGDHSLAGYLMAISDLATIRDRADEGHVAYGWGNHAEAGYVTSSGVTSITIKGTSPIVSSSSSAITTTGTRTISIANAYGDIKNPYGAKTANTILAGPTTGSAAVPTFRELEQSDIPTLDWSKINATVSTTTVGSASAGTNISADDITAWDPGVTPTLGTAIPADDITAWDAGSTPTLGTAISADDITAWSAGSLPTLGTAISADDITAWSAGTLPTLGTAIPADDITDWTTNVPTEVVPNTVVIGGSTTSIPNISKKTVVTSVTKKTVVTGGSTTDVPNISKKTVVTGGSTTDVPNISKKTVVTGGSTTDVPNISKKTVITSVSLSGGILTINTGDSVTVGTAIKAYTTLNTGDSVTVGTPIKAYTSLTTGDSVTVGNPIKAYTSLTTGDSVTVSTGDSVTVGTAIEAYTSLTTGPAATVTAGTAASLDYSAKSIPNITGVGTLPSLSYTSRSIPNVTGVGTLPSLSYTSRSIPNVTDVGTTPSLTYTAKSIPNITSVGSTPTLTYTSRSIPNISVTNKTVVTGITTP